MIDDAIEPAGRPPVPGPMTATEARRCADAIRGHLDGARVLILELHERRGWEALGYTSWRECVVQEFDRSKTHLYRQLEAARIEREISPMGEIGSIPERQLRELVALDAPEMRRAVWEEARATAPGGKVTAQHVAALVARRRADAELTRHEATIGVHREMTEALRAIRDRHLYRRTHTTFEDYCRERWDLDADDVAEMLADVSGGTEQDRGLGLIASSRGLLDEAQEALRAAYAREFDVEQPNDPETFRLLDRHLRSLRRAMRNFGEVLRIGEGSIFHDADEVIRYFHALERVALEGQNLAAEGQIRAGRRIGELLLSMDETGAEGG